MTAFPAEQLHRLRETGVVAVLILDDLATAVPTARALLAGGITVMELTLRTPVALDCLRAIVAEVPEMTAGVGTILTPAQVDEALAAGAAFGVAPGVNPRVLGRAAEVGLPFGPGAATPTDVEAALEFGCRTIKFFPAEPIGGLPYLAAMAAPYRHLGVRFIPLGGVNAANLATYLQAPDVLAVGGSWLAPADLLRTQNWGAITQRAAEARRIAAGARA